ncbi:MAG: FtsW/RodA/SpoVE family cell cycle protein, partial [Ktedonobacteraceae bacterium]|nr:FtsW/RodA/SpoVE family cell cycle protein [Ktedonobacteraceae bacterium]
MRREQFPPSMRSPALKAVEQQRSTHQVKRSMEQQPASTLLVTSVASQKRTGLTANWRLRRAPQGQPAHTPVQVMSEEEQKKLAELEMHLSRVAGKIDSWLLILVLALLCIGLVMLYSASSFLSARYYGDASYFFVRQLLSALIGVVVMLVTMRIDY